VVDSKNNLVSGADVMLGFYTPRKKDDGVYGKTDTGGLFSAIGTPVNEVNYQVKKDGYYTTEGKYVFYRPNDTNIVKDGRWQPWNPTNMVVLKERRNPVPMFAREVEIEMPAQNVPVGFDLEKGDWVAPYGKGIQPDLLFRYASTNTGPNYLDFSCQLEMTFNNPHDGIQVLPIDGTSKLRSLYEAPESDYGPRLLLQCERTPYKIIKKTEIDADQYLVFRVRSITDNNGSITNAKYGKIYGPIQYGILSGHHISFEYYLNHGGTRNMEYDPKQNLYLMAADKDVKKLDEERLKLWREKQQCRMRLEKKQFKTPTMPCTNLNHPARAFHHDVCFHAVANLTAFAFLSPRTL